MNYRFTFDYSLILSANRVIGLSARARSVFRVVTALAPPFVMESELDEDGLCLRGLPCHRLSATGLSFGHHMVLWIKFNGTYFIRSA